MSTLSVRKPQANVTAMDLQQFLKSVGDRLMSRQGVLLAVDNSFVARHEPYPFLGKAKQLVYDYIKSHVTVNDIYSLEDVSVTWFNKDGGDWAAVMTSKLQPNIFYRVAHDSRAKETTIAVYNKFDIQTFPDKESY